MRTLTETAAAVQLPPTFADFVLLIAATKGGAGKSTLAINLATLAHADGIRSIIFDADIEDGQQSCVRWSETRAEPGPKVVAVEPRRIIDAIGWARQQGYQFIVIDTPGRDMALTKAVLDHADFMLTPAQPSPLDLRATKPIQRLWKASVTPAAIVLNGVVRENLPRTRAYLDRYAEQGWVLPTVVGRRVQYVDAVERGLGVSEYLPGDIGDREMRRLLAAVLSAAERRRVGQ